MAEFSSEREWWEYQVAENSSGHAEGCASLGIGRVVSRESFPRQNLCSCSVLGTAKTLADRHDWK